MTKLVTCKITQPGLQTLATVQNDIFLLEVELGLMRNPLLLKMRHISFLMFSVSLGVALVIASPSSR